MTPADHALRHGRRLVQHAVDAEAHAHLVAVGLEVDVRGAPLDGLGDDRVDELDDRRVVGRLAQVDDLAEPLVVLLARRPRWTTSSRRLRRLMSARDVLAARRRPGGPRSPSSARCRRPRGRWPGRPSRRCSGALADEGDGHRLVALGRRGRRSGWRPPCRPGRRRGRGGRGRGARRSRGRAGPRSSAPQLEQHLLGRACRVARGGLDGLLDALARRRSPARR